MTFEDDKQRRKRRIHNKRRDRDRTSNDKWWSPDVDKKPRRSKIDWSEYADSDDDEDNFGEENDRNSSR